MTEIGNHRFTSFRWLSPLLFTFLSGPLFGQITVTATSGDLGPDNYTTLKGAFDAINAGTHQGVISISVTSNTTETATALLTASGIGSSSYTSVMIQPSGGGARTIEGAMAPGSALIDLNGADNVTLDGLNSGGNSLTISNLTVSSNAGTCTIKMQGDATLNTITRCTVKGSSTMSFGADGGNIWIAGSAISSGNDNNTISYCDIGPAGNNLPGKCICIKGTPQQPTSPLNNSGNVITGNNIFDFFTTATLGGGGVELGAAAIETTISDNRIYQTAPRVQTGSGGGITPIRVANPQGNGNQILNNIIGFANSNGTGTLSIDFQTTGGGAFFGIFLQAGTLSGTLIQGNTIAGISISGNISGTGTSPKLVGIYHSVGLAVIDGNTIGSMSETSSITFNSTSPNASDINGINYFGIANWEVTNNSIGGIAASNSNNAAITIHGIRSVNAVSSVFTGENNIIGGAVANSIQITSTSTANQVIGIYHGSGIAEITGNTIRNLSTANGTGTGAAASLIGIDINSPTTNHTVTDNQIYQLSNTSASAIVNVTGIYFNGSSGSNLVERNLIYGLSATTSNAMAEISGIYSAAGTTAYQNNIVALGAGVITACKIYGIHEPAGTNNFYHNSIYIGGAPTTGSSASFAFFSSVVNNTRKYRNNIFVNARSNNGATGKNYAVSVGGTAANPPGLTINNNIYYVSGTGTVFGLFNGADVANLSAWQTAVGQDAGSFEDDPEYVDPTNSEPNLHVQYPTPAEGTGADVGVANDYDGEMRAGLTPVDIGGDAGDYANAPVSEVTNANDSGPGSLRDVITNSSAGATITFAPALMGQTITLTSGEININKNLSISGLGMQDLTISGNNASRIFHLFSGYDLLIENLALKNAAAVSNGGAIYIEGDLLLENVLFQNNYQNGIAKAMTVTNTALIEIAGITELKL